MIQQEKSLGRVEEKRTRQILAAAVECVSEGGVEQLTLRKVAQRAGVSIGMISRYFPTKDDLLIATLDESARQMVALGRTFPRQLRGFDAIRWGLAAAVTPPMESSSNWPFWLEFAARAIHEPKLREHHVARLDKLRELMVSALAEIEPEASEKDRELTAELFTILYQGMGMSVTLDRDRVPVERALEIYDFLISLIKNTTRQ